MTTVKTLYGEISGVEFQTLFSNGKVDGCLVSMPNLLKTPYGDLVPQYVTEDLGRRSIKPVYFNKDGTLKSIALQMQTPIQTSVGIVPAELVTFYKNGKLRRIFPLDGQITGFWTDKNEFELAEAIEIDSPVGKLKAKFIGIQFYESGALKSLTLWPGQKLTIPTRFGEVKVRTGIAFYENGSIRSFEPDRAVDVLTPIGKLSAYDSEPVGIHGDLNSLQFTENEEVEALSTTEYEVLVTTPDGITHVFYPGEKHSLCSDAVKVVVPMQIQFQGGMVTFTNGRQESFELAKCRFEVKKVNRKALDPVYSCAS
ncbi:MAG: hypothetical protein HGB11_01130 [Chlorobiales bacterium]|nr:hypothetical protein [Chlorobiales bacterium]